MIITVVVLVVLVVGYGIIFLRGRLLHAKMAATRNDVTIDAFVQSFRGMKYSREAIEAAYTDLYSLSRLPIQKDDDLEFTLGLLPEDMESTLAGRCRTLGVPDAWKSLDAHLFPLKTVEDYVKLLSSIMKNESTHRR